MILTKETAVARSVADALHAKRKELADLQMRITNLETGLFEARKSVTLIKADIAEMETFLTEQGVAADDTVANGVSLLDRYSK